MHNLYLAGIGGFVTAVRDSREFNWSYGIYIQKLNGRARVAGACPADRSSDAEENAMSLFGV